MPGASIRPWRAHARRGIRGKRDGETGGLITTRTELIQAAKLSNETEPPHRVAVAPGGQPLANPAQWQAKVFEFEPFDVNECLYRAAIRPQSTFREFSI